MKNKFNILLLFFLGCVFFATCKKEPTNNSSSTILQITNVAIGGNALSPNGNNINLPSDKPIIIEFNYALDTTVAKANIHLTKSDNTNVACILTFFNDNKSVNITPIQNLINYTNYTLTISSSLKTTTGVTFAGATFNFTTVNGIMTISSITLNGQNFGASYLKDINTKNINIEINFSDALNASNYQTFFAISGNPTLNFALSNNNKKLDITIASPLSNYIKYNFYISNSLLASDGFGFKGFSNNFYTSLDSTNKFPVISDDDLLTLVQRQTFKYFWENGHPACGMARERNTSGDVVTMGGSGFGVMAMVVAMSRGFISRADGMTRLDKILTFLETCDRFHGAWSHWMNGNTGKVVPFGAKDDGADVVETTFMIQGLLTMRQYLNSSDVTENSYISRINTLYQAIDFPFFTQGQNVLYWNWSPTYGFAVNVQLKGYNETLITHVIAASSPTHPISKAVYTEGYASNGAIKNGKTFYGYVLPLGQDYGGPLFFTHYSYLGLDPRKLQDQYANYWTQNVNQSMINYLYCVSNPRGYVGYSKDSWGLTASDNNNGYFAQSPTSDLGVISPTAAVSALPYVPTQSLQAIRFFYYKLGDKMWGDQGFYDAFNVTANWYATSYLAIDQGPEICMIENYRTQLLWNLFMTCPEIQTGLTNLGFTYQ